MASWTGGTGAGTRYSLSTRGRSSGKGKTFATLPSGGGSAPAPAPVENFSTIDGRAVTVAPDGTEVNASVNPNFSSISGRSVYVPPPQIAPRSGSASSISSQQIPASFAPTQQSSSQRVPVGSLLAGYTGTPWDRARFERRLEGLAYLEQREREAAQRQSDIFRFVPGGVLSPFPLRGDNAVQRVTRGLLSAPSALTAGFAGQLGLYGTRAALVAEGLRYPDTRQRVLPEVLRSARAVPGSVLRSAGDVVTFKDPTRSGQVAGQLLIGGYTASRLASGARYDATPKTFTGTLKGGSSGGGLLSGVLRVGNRSYDVVRSLGAGTPTTRGLLSNINTRVMSGNVGRTVFEQARTINTMPQNWLSAQAFSRGAMAAAPKVDGVVTSVTRSIVRNRGSVTSAALTTSARQVPSGLFYGDIVSRGFFGLGKRYSTPYVGRVSPPVNGARSITINYSPTAPISGRSLASFPAGRSGQISPSLPRPFYEPMGAPTVPTPAALPGLVSSGAVRGLSRVVGGLSRAARPRSPVIPGLPVGLANRPGLFSRPSVPSAPVLPELRAGAIPASFPYSKALNYTPVPLNYTPARDSTLPRSRTVPDVVPEAGGGSGNIVNYISGGSSSSRTVINVTPPPVSPPSVAPPLVPPGSLFGLGGLLPFGGGGGGGGGLFGGRGRVDFRNVYNPSIAGSLFKTSGTRSQARTAGVSGLGIRPFLVRR